MLTLLKLCRDLRPDQVRRRYELKLTRKLSAELHFVKIRTTRWAREQMRRDLLINLGRQLVVTISRTKFCYVLAKHLFKLFLELTQT